MKKSSAFIFLTLLHRVQNQFTELLDSPPKAVNPTSVYGTHKATKRSIAQSSDLTLDIQGSDRELDSATPHITDFLGGWPENDSAKRDFKEGPKLRDFLPFPVPDPDYHHEFSHQAKKLKGLSLSEGGPEWLGLSLSNPPPHTQSSFESSGSTTTPIRPQARRAVLPSFEHSVPTVSPSSEKSSNSLEASQAEASTKSDWYIKNSHEVRIANSLARFQKIYDAGRQSRPETSGLHEKEFQEERIAKSLRRFEKAHEAGQQSRLETSGRQKGSTSGSKIPELDNNERPTPVLWAWIYSMMLGVSKSLHDEITQIKKNEISRFVANLASSVCRSMGHEVRVRTNELTSPESSNSFKEFAHLLWSVNSKFVRVFVPSEEDYYGAQFNLQEWVLELFAPSEGGEASIPKVEVAVSQTEKAPLTDVIIRALFAKYSIPAYYIVGKMKKYPLESIFPKQVLLAEAVVDAMMLYYKSQTSLISGMQAMTRTKFL
ncbi:hypothetical protein PCANC_12080 [Puccinia coronata f. sp. avenae]|uniref:Uncharacterized protein n=1 Tax=Puccinia coronata f. sp. avenae TaxID=200324 RepID=A0A2N5TFE8_9BASI|nr:hypothetical protein PCANC_12080 [Puccinia coronata f. sp. avenae]PLW24226.1 hypothetical protein PCASD_10481 [Puccinia coronata f. sp. avenae]